MQINYQYGEHISPPFMTTELQQLLEKIGFSHHESRVYLQLLHHGEQPASVIAKQGKTPRSTIRSILDKLCQKGVVGKVYRGNTQYYYCLSTDALVHSLEQEAQEKESHIEHIREALPLFCAARGEKSVLPKVQFFEGEKGIVEAFNHSLYAGADEILFLTSYNFFTSDLVRKNDIDFYMPMRAKKNIKMRTLSEDNDHAKHFAGTAKQYLREHRFLSDTYEIAGTYLIYGNFVLYFSANDGEYIAVLTESILMAQTMRTMFECMWEHSRASMTL